ncbi:MULTISPECIES: Arc family DNA-binding protein [Nonomuraea]|uniref:Arc family DNA-binding protein n=2 Tax=Nonomuraea TaxID=83681 RepID=A0A7Y6MBL7_9ACTN|nr:MULTISPECIES: Arc family DNA-binding protein [Nonomuraea]MCP2345096.1 putative transcriptional regulator [Nonomuraea roseoviolacea subsp. carminata]NUW40624.1 Arc family DNA-binding protein [Nonomuraea rhodomycinica]
MAETRLRLPDETYEQIKKIAGDDGQSVNSAMVAAIDDYIARRRRERYRAIGRKVAERDRELLERLAR